MYAMTRSKKPAPDSGTATASRAARGNRTSARKLSPPRKTLPAVPAFEFSPIKVEILRGREFADDYRRTIYSWWNEKARPMIPEGEREQFDHLLATVRVLKGRQVELDSYPRVLDVEVLLRVGPPAGQPAGQVAYFEARVCSDETQTQRVALVVDGHSFALEYLELDEDLARAEDQYLSDAATVLFRALSSSALDLETALSPEGRFYFLSTLLPQSVAPWGRQDCVPLATSEAMEQRIAAARNAS